MPLNRADLPLRLRNPTLSVFERLRAARLRPTQARVSILQWVAVEAHPVTAEDVFRNLAEGGMAVSMGTTYRVLGEFVSAGLLAREWVPGNSGPRAAYSVPHRHVAEAHAATHRLVCRSCRRSVGFQDGELMERLRKLTGWNIPADPRLSLTIEIERCMACRTCSATLMPTTGGCHQESLTTVRST
ncbi:Fur family transcriptional regulator [Pseudothauera rhizosphaerae]|uniref:Ferric uptake regulation protein n=1 Tax=Pseudothauera rhizosphaerae TaxID=2565932 RepID=A0A4S4ANK8_9RHOO|nr:transcriptional repressor [Pseudothauera rhizosphaerae]THF61237.1 hypothetical protein E6O51_10465 [Pseudothauera rhizosphaerae]